MGGLDAETAAHTSIMSLSGGQKVKVVLGASMWQCPHILILDEPTNYLDRDALGALTLAIKEYEGGIIIISHNREFCNAVATEKWIMKAGRLTQEGSSAENAKEEEKPAGNTEPEVKLDASGNVIEMKDSEMDVKKKKKLIKDIEKQLQKHKKKPYLSDSEMWELEDRLLQLNA